MSDDALEQAWRAVVEASLTSDAQAESRALAELQRAIAIPTQRESDENRIDWDSPGALLALEVSTLRAAVEAATACLETKRFDEALDVLLAADAPARSGRLRWNNRRQR